MAELHRWNDDRLDDLAKRVEEAMAVHSKISTLEVQVATVTQQSTTCLTEIRRVRELQEEAEDHRMEREEQQRRERKSDRKWTLGTLLVVATLVITALGVFLG